MKRIHAQQLYLVLASMVLMGCGDKPIFEAPTFERHNPKVNAMR
jgi:hypothetical protein